MMSFEIFPGSPDALAGVAAVVLVVLAGLWILVAIASLICYVLEALGLYTIAKRRAIHHAWLAWVPVGELWILGSIADQYQYVVRGRVVNRRKILVLLSIVGMLISLISLSLTGPLQYQVSLNNFHLQYDAHAAASGSLVLIAIASALFGLLSLVIHIAKIVYRYIALYDLYCSCTRNNDVLFLIFSIIFPFTRPFFLFACRNKDEGMPPRRQQHVTPPAYEQPQYHDAQPANEEYQAEEAPAESVAQDQPPTEYL